MRDKQQFRDSSRSFRLTQDTEPRAGAPLDDISSRKNNTRIPFVCIPPLVVASIENGSPVALKSTVRVPKTKTAADDLVWDGENAVRGGGKALLASITALKTERTDSRLSAVLQRLSDYKSGKADESGGQLVGSLEDELADIISLFQNERVTQAQEIQRLKTEVGRLNGIAVIRRSQPQAEAKEESSSGSSVQEAKIKGLEELLHKMHRECFDSRSQILKLQEAIKGKDQKIEELQRTLREKMKENVAGLAGERNYRNLQAEIDHLKSTLMQKGKEAAESGRKAEEEAVTAMARRKTEESKRLLAALKEKNEEVKGLKSRLEQLENQARMQTVNPDGRVIEELMARVQGLEKYLKEGREERKQKMQEYVGRIRQVEQEMKAPRGEQIKKGDRLCQEINDLKGMLLDMEHKYSVQTACDKTPHQDGIVCFSKWIIVALASSRKPPATSTPHIPPFEAINNENLKPPSRSGSKLVKPVFSSSSSTYSKRLWRSPPSLTRRTASESTV